MTRTLTILAALMAPLLAVPGAFAQERLPWEKPSYGVEPPPTGRPAPYPVQARDPDADPYGPRSRYEPPAPRTPPPRTEYREPPPSNYGAPPRSSYGAPPPSNYGAPPPTNYGAPPPTNYGAPPPTNYGAPRRPDDAYRPPQRQHAAPYEPPPRYAPPPRPIDDDRTYSRNEVLDAGHKFFGSVSKGLADAIARLFRDSGRPNGYILGEDAGGAFVAGLRYGEGTLYTKYGAPRRVYWQGPSVGYDFGGEGSRTMTLVYNLRHPSQLFRRFGGVQGSAYVVGGVGVQFLKHDDVTLAPIRSGVGLRLGANIGYLKFTRRPTWNPF